MTVPLVLVHGGGFDRRCWDVLTPHLSAPSLAVDLPGRGRHPALPSEVTFAACAASVAADVDAAGFDEVVLVGHSLAGCSMPSIAGALGDRVRHLVFVACTVPGHGSSALDTLAPDVRAIAAAPGPDEPRVMDESIARLVLGDDLDESEFAWCVERLVGEAIGLVTEPVDLTPLRSSTAARTWVRTLQDLIVPPDRQLRFAANAGDCALVDIDTGHMCMVSQPGQLAAILDTIAAAIEPTRR